MVSSLDCRNVYACLSRAGCYKAMLPSILSSFSSFNIARNRIIYFRDGNVSYTDRSGPPWPFIDHKITMIIISY